MIVVADTSPLNYLIQLGEEKLLQKIYARVVVPEAVMRELRHENAPTPVQDWLEEVPSWIEVRTVRLEEHEGLGSLGAGEREAIWLAEEEDADLILMDERKGRLAAKQRGLATTGTLGILLTAGELGLIDPVIAYRRLLAETTFRTSAELEAQIRGRLGTI